MGNLTLAAVQKAVTSPVTEGGGIGTRTAQKDAEMIPV
jgi:hypothetical protein